MPEMEGQARGPLRGPGAWFSDIHGEPSRLGQEETCKRWIVDCLYQLDRPCSVPDFVAWPNGGQMVGMNPWCLDYGHEQAHRQEIWDDSQRSHFYRTAWPRSMADRYNQRKVELVMTERMHVMAIKLAKAEVIVRTGDHIEVAPDSPYGLLSSRSKRWRYQAPLFVLGPKPLWLSGQSSGPQSVHRSQVERFIYDPAEQSWHDRCVGLMQRLDHLANAKRPPRSDLIEALRDAWDVLKIAKDNPPAEGQQRGTAPTDRWRNAEYGIPAYRHDDG